MTVDTSNVKVHRRESKMVEDTASYMSKERKIESDLGSRLRSSTIF